MEAEGSHKLKSPPAPEELRKMIPPEIRTLRVGAGLVRIYRKVKGRSWRTFRMGDTGGIGRFDPFVPGVVGVERRGVWYGVVGTPEGDSPGENLAFAACLAEVFQQSRTVLARRTDRFHVAAFRVTRPLRLLDLTRRWPTRTRRASALLLSCADLGRAREWACAIYEAYPDLDGIYYTSSMCPPQPVVALYERARDAFPAEPAFDVPLWEPGLWDDLRKARREINYRIERD